MAVCSWNKDQAWIELRLAGVRPNSLGPPQHHLNFLGMIKLGPRLGIQADPTHDTDPQPSTTCRTLHSSQGVGERGQQFHHSFLWSGAVPPSPFYFSPAPISWNALQKHVQGLNSVHCFQSSLPHLDSCGVAPVVVWVSATWILLLCYHSTSATETQWWHVKNIW